MKKWIRWWCAGLSAVLLLTGTMVFAEDGRRSYLEAFVSRLYETCLERGAGAEEIAFWADRLESGQSTGAETAYGFIFSEEYKRKQEDDAAFVAMLYRTVLGREPDGREQQGWLDYLRRGASREWVFSGFVNSEEYTRICNRYQVERGSYLSHKMQDQNLQVTGFVIRLYENCLGRRPGPYEQGLEDWTGCLLRGELTGAEVAWGFLDSQEMRRKNLSDSAYVELLYQALMGRNPDASGMGTWMDALEKGVSRRYVARGFFGSQEFARICRQYGIAQGQVELSEARDLYPEISGFVKGFYASCLGRTPSGSELNDWTGKLAAGTVSGPAAATGFFLSEEYTRKNQGDAAFVADAYEALLGRSGSASERASWERLLGQGWSREEVLLSMAGSSEFQARCAKLGIAGQSGPREVGPTAGTGILYGGGTGPLIVVDAGHQSRQMRDTEPNGPGSSVRKAKVSSGTQGTATGMEEYRVNLQVALLLRDELLSRGYRVLMTRETNEVQLSNVQRAQLANDNGAAAMVRIHCNSSDSSSVRGALGICQTAGNPYCGNIYSECLRLTEAVLKGHCQSTGVRNTGVWETDTMTGTNWCQVPNTIIEMGYMSNPSEDRLLVSDTFQRQAAQGIADGLDAYFGR